MVEQLGLFPEQHAETPGFICLEGDAGSLDEAFAACAHLRERANLIALLEAVGRFARYSPLNGYLLFLQNPQATRVATAAHWLRRHGRRLLPGARPLAILAPMSPVKFVFDVADTQGPGPLAAPAITGTKGLNEMLARITENTAGHGIAVKQSSLPETHPGFAAPLTLHNRHLHEGIDPQSAYLVVLNADRPPEQRLSDLAGLLGQIFCGHHGIDAGAWWPDRRTIAQRTAELEAAAAAYLVCRRRAIAAPTRHVFETAPERLLPAFSLATVFAAVTAIEQMARAGRKQGQPRQARRMSPQG